MAEEGYHPEMSDAAVMAKTGKTWDQWFALLDKAGAARLGHREIVKLAANIGEAGPWWRQWYRWRMSARAGCGASTRRPPAFR